MHVGEDLRRTDEEIEQLLSSGRRSPQRRRAARQVLAGPGLHGEVSGRRGQAPEVVGPNDSGVAKLAEDSELALNMRWSNARVADLQCHELVLPAVANEEDSAHSSGAQLARELVTGRKQPSGS